MGPLPTKGKKTSPHLPSGSHHKAGRRGAIAGQHCRHGCPTNCLSWGDTQPLHLGSRAGHLPAEPPEGAAASAPSRFGSSRSQQGAAQEPALPVAGQPQHRRPHPPLRPHTIASPTVTLLGPPSRTPCVPVEKGEASAAAVTEHCWATIAANHCRPRHNRSPRPAPLAATGPQIWAEPRSPPWPPRARPTA